MGLLNLDFNRGFHIPFHYEIFTQRFFLPWAKHLPQVFCLFGQGVFQNSSQRFLGKVFSEKKGPVFSSIPEVNLVICGFTIKECQKHCTFLKEILRIFIFGALARRNFFES